MGLFAPGGEHCFFLPLGATVVPAQSGPFPGTTAPTCVVPGGSWELSRAGKAGCGRQWVSTHTHRAGARRLKETQQHSRE